MTESVPNPYELRTIERRMFVTSQVADIIPRQSGAGNPPETQS